MPTGGAHPFALARWLQETAFEDGLDSGFGAEAFWIIRRLTLTIRGSRSSRRSSS